ncbi:mechanosensitive ion channel family protein [Desulfobacterota bacterium AH_259_B03_O07]|nr:mechanosensitive ion channel family protein [Desulfobacterota bacterium AH_259_B03_O07]
METLTALGDKVIPYGTNIVIGILIFVGFWIAGLISSRVIRRIGEESGRGEYITRLLARVTKVAVVVIGAITALGTFGVNVSALVAGLGLTGFALGFAIKDVLANTLAGILILTYRPFKPNDRISVSGQEGTVIQIDLRYTTLQAEGKKILIPNSTLFTNILNVFEDG